MPATQFLRIRNKFLPLILLLSLFPALITAKGLIPVRNFTLDDYSFGTQNWGAAQDSIGRMYFANNDGMLLFDGCRWHRYKLPNFTAVRSLCLSYPSGRIYVGGTGEFGYFSADSISGNLKYHSLIPTLPTDDRNFTEIWNIFDSGGKIWFQGDYSLFRYDGHATVAFPLDARIATSSLIGGAIYIALKTGRLLRFSGSRAEPLPGTEMLDGKKISAIVPGPGGADLIIVTADNGLFHYRQNSLLPMTTVIDDFLKENQVFCATSNGGVYAFGTVLDGAVIYDQHNDTATFINRENGMQNRTVLSLEFDRANNLWMMLDNGIDYAIYQSPVTDLVGESDEVGAGYASILWRGRLYLATNQGLYSRRDIETGNNSVREPLTRELTGQVWALDTLGGSLMVNADAGLFYNSGSGLRKIDGIDGSYRVRPLLGHPGKGIVSTYSRFHVIERNGAAWHDLGALNGYDDIGGNFFQDSHGDIWISHWIKGVFRLIPDSATKSFVRIELFDRHAGLPSDGNNSAFMFGDNVYISSQQDIFLYDRLTGKLRKANEINKLFKPRGTSRVHALPENRLIKVSSGNIEIATLDIGGEFRIDTTTYRSLSDHLIPGFESFCHVGDNEVIASSQNGFKVLDMAAGAQSHKPPHTFVSRIITDKDSVLYMAGLPVERRGAIKIPYNLNTIQIEYSTPDFTSPKAVEYSTMLEGYDKGWSPFATKADRLYTQLPEGRYTFRIRTRMAYTGAVSEIEFPITLLPPWYASPVAIVIYVIVASLLIWGGYHRLRRWKERAEIEARERKEAELQEVIRRSERESLVKDHEIAVLKSQQLEHDIKHKSNELGNITMNLIRKNDMLLSLANKISRILDHPDIRNSESDIRSQLRKLQTQIRENISHDDDWKSFTENFDIVYQDYTKRLMERHPNLSPTDLRTCCYIRMGLSSKEIAPLFNISYRSVEMSRYRLRKKMSLDRDVSLTEYLQNL